VCVYVDSVPALQFSAPTPGVVARAAFDDIYDANFDYVWRIVARLGVRRPAVEDVVQEVFIVVHRKLGDFEGRSSMHTWLFQIARRVVHDHRRTVRRKEPYAGDDDPAVPLEGIAAGEEHSPDASAARAEAMRLVCQLLDKLDDEKREVFILAELEQLPAPQIAEAVGVNVNTVYSRLRLAREAFNQALARHRAREGRQP
jgi:RNA polymerase sigma-70 factor (ECF subfamily)